MERELDALCEAIVAAGIEGELDEIVHDFKSEEAAEINNGGLRSQAGYILEACGSLEGALAALGLK